MFDPKTNNTWQKRCIQWTTPSTQKDLDCADELVIVSGSITYLQEKTDKQDIFSKQTEHNIDTKKTKVMTINASVEPVIFHWESQKEADDLHSWEAF